MAAALHHASNPAAPRGAIPSLDGIRAIAVLMVFFAHSGLEHLVPGGLGVTVFFVLSGYLITTLMRIEHARSGSLDLRAFYLRRFLRLMPPLAIVVALAGGLSALGVIDGAFTVEGLLSALFYVGNYHVIATDFQGMPAGLGVVWSLAIEEHYYLFFPPLALWLMSDRRTGFAAGVLAVLCVAVLAWRCWLVSVGANPDYIVMATDTRVDAILVGSMLALVRNPWLAPTPGAAVPTTWALRRDAAIAAAAVAVLLATLVWRDETFRLTLRFTLQSLAVAALIRLAVLHAHRWPARWLGARPLVYIGSVSYTIYLVHHVVLLGLTRHWPDLGWAPLTLAGAALTLAVAEPMRRWVDVPLARVRQRLHAGRAPQPGLEPSPQTVRAR